MQHKTVYFFGNFSCFCSSFG